MKIISQDSSTVHSLGYMVNSRGTWSTLHSKTLEENNMATAQMQEDTWWQWGKGVQLCSAKTYSRAPDAILQKTWTSPAGQGFLKITSEPIFHFWIYFLMLLHSTGSIVKKHVTHSRITKLKRILSSKMAS